MSVRNRTDRDQSSEAVLAAIGIPAFMLFVALLTVAGRLRLAIAHQAVELTAVPEPMGFGT